MKVRGSITVFSALAFLVLISIFLAIIERGRILCAKAEIETSIYSSQRSIAGYYQNDLWEKYDILGLDFSKDREKLIKRYLDDNSNIKNNKIFTVKYNNINILPHSINTEGGYEFARQAVKCMKYRLTGNLISKIKGGDDKKEEGDNIADISEDVGSDVQDPREIAKKVEDDDSFMNFVLGNNYSKKVLNHTSKIIGKSNSVGAINSLFFNEYLLSHFTTIVTSDNSENKLDYEVEYIIKGKHEDEKNIKKILRDIKLIRLPINVAFLKKDVIYNNLARLASIILAGLTFNIEAIKVTKEAIITSWAYLESCLDVKGLIQGKKVPLIKNRNNWNLGIMSLLHFWNIEPKDNEKGLKYEDFLRGFLLLTSNSKKIKRGIDLIEANLDIDMNNIAYKFETNINYSVDKKMMNPFLNDDIYNQEVIAAYGYK